MKVTGYEFGKITIDSRTYTSDVIIAPDRVFDSWWRKQGHSLAIEDLEQVLRGKPQVLVVGTGYYGRMQIPAKTRQYLQDQGVALREAKTREAILEFNELQKECASIVAALHLTC